MKIKSRDFTYFSNLNLAALTPKELHPEIEKVIIVVHGSECNADTYYGSIDFISRNLGVFEKTLIIAPRFVSNYHCPNRQAPNSPVWTDEGWIRGDQALNTPSLSSYDVIDQFVSIASDSDHFPNVTEVIVTGHSAGGQLTQRYAFSNLIDGEIKPHMRYLVLNPGSYLYLNSVRPNPPNPTTCPNFDNYKYGLKNLNKYLSRKRTKKLIEFYLKRDVTYMLGEMDTSRELDISCSGDAQGLNRFERGTNFKRYLEDQFKENVHQILTVPGVAHTQSGMYKSEIGIKVLFP